MPIFLGSDHLPLTEEEVEKLWQVTCSHRHYSDVQVNIRCVSEQEMRTLNTHYRGKDAPTNVLTFSYPSTPAVAGQAGSGQVPEHDIALCLPVARAEARKRQVELRDYVALLLVHAFLHVTGMDHERSAPEEEQTAQAETTILKRAGFAAGFL